MKKETIWHDEAVKVRGITMTEFNLSEKIKTKHEFNYQYQGFHSDPELLEVTDVKEFIRLLKEEAKENLNPDESYWFVKFIEEKAGENSNEQRRTKRTIERRF